MKGITKLVEAGYMTNRVEDVVAFIRLSGDRLSPREVRAVQTAANKSC
jgi:hypothetical protein